MVVFILQTSFGDLCFFSLFCLLRFAIECMKFILFTFFPFVLLVFFCQWAWIIALKLALVSRIVIYLNNIPKSAFFCCCFIAYFTHTNKRNERRKNTKSTIEEKTKKIYIKHLCIRSIVQLYEGGYAQNGKTTTKYKKKNNNKKRNIHSNVRQKIYLYSFVFSLPKISTMVTQMQVCKWH